MDGLYSAHFMNIYIINWIHQYISKSLQDQLSVGHGEECTEDSLDGLGLWKLAWDFWGTPGPPPFRRLYRFHPLRLAVLRSSVRCIPSPLTFLSSGSWWLCRGGLVPVGGIEFVKGLCWLCDNVWIVNIICLSRAVNITKVACVLLLLILQKWFAYCSLICVA